MNNNNTSNTSNISSLEDICINCSDECPHKGEKCHKIQELQLSSPNGQPLVATLDQQGKCCLFSGFLTHHSNEIWLHAESLKYLEERNFKLADW